MGATSLRLPDDLIARLDAEAECEGCPTSELVSAALAEYLQRHERERFMAEIVEAARLLSADPQARAEALEVAEDFLPADNAALDLAEGRRPGIKPRDTWTRKRVVEGVRVRIASRQAPEYAHPHRNKQPRPS